MFVNFSKILIICAFAQSVIEAQHSPRPFKLKTEYLNKRLVGYSLFETKVFEHPHCAIMCMFFSVCESINFAKKEKICELNSEGTETAYSMAFIEDKGTLYSDITDWPKSLASGCKNHNCEDHQQCFPFGNDAFKFIDIYCEEPSKVTNAVVEPGSRLAGSIRTYTFTCLENQYAVGKTSIKCRHNESWTALEARCKRLPTCADLNECNPAFTDGEYWLFPLAFGDDKLKVYCHGMDGDVPEDFITLNAGNNFAYDSGSTEGGISSTQTYNKIRLDLQTMIIDTNRSDFTVSNPVGSFVEYGQGAGCMGAVADGHFQIDSRGTGLKFGSTLYRMQKQHSQCVYLLKRLISDFEDGIMQEPLEEEGCIFNL